MGDAAYSGRLLGPMRHSSAVQQASTSYRKAYHLAKKLEKHVTTGAGGLSLHLGYAGINSDSMPVVLRHCRLRDIQELDLRCNGINPDTFLILAHSLQHDRLGIRRLGLKLNHVGLDGNIRGVDAFADALLTNTRLTFLDLRYNRLGDVHMPAFRRVIEKHSILQTLLLSFNVDITDAGAKTISKALEGNYTLKSLQLGNCSVSSSLLDQIESKMQRNRDSVVSVDPDTGEVIIKARGVTLEDRAELVEDPCVKKVRLMLNMQHVSRYLHELNVECMSSKVSKLHAEDKQKALNHAFMDQESALVQEILHLEELVTTFSEEKRDLEKERSKLSQSTKEDTAKLSELEQRRSFYHSKMTDRIKSLNKLVTVSKNKCTELQEKDVLARGELEKEQKEGARLRQYLQRCKDDIEAQFPKPELN